MFFYISGWQFPVPLVQTKIFNQLISFLKNDTPYPYLDPNSLIYIPYPRMNCLKTIPFKAAHTKYPMHGTTPSSPPLGHVRYLKRLTCDFSTLGSP